MPTLDWIGKKAVVNHHREVPYRLGRLPPNLRQIQLFALKHTLPCVTHMPVALTQLFYYRIGY